MRLTFPLAHQAGRARRWRSLVEEHGFDPRRFCLAPAETRRAPRTAVRARLSTLLRTYAGDYHSDSYDVERLAAQVLSGTERILFWGEEESIAALRGWTRAGHEPTDAELDGLALGTATVLDVAHEFGEGHAEMCRTGSVCRSVPSTGPILWDVLALLGEEPGGAFAGCHTFLSVPRNRRTTPQIRGGAAIHRFHVHDLGSSFWGVAPWYVMQGGFLEVLDYRELYRSPAAAAAQWQGAELWLTAEPEAAFAAALLELNLCDAEAPGLRLLRPAPPRPARWRVCAAASPALVRYQPGLVWPDAAGPFHSLHGAVRDLEARGCACVTVCLPLEDPGWATYQQRLGRAGFHLAGLLAPRQAAGERRPCHGMWSRPRPGVSLAEPYYLAAARPAPGEEAVLHHLSRICRDWSAAGGSDPAREPRA
ncbi:MAG TPA: hypothetical protein VKM72_20730 [Thermoanaerobaculia bacterium]|nr:hypothetical protein [Thermoanaerobaculia bacterium]